MAATGADTSYRPGVYRERGGNAFVVKATATQTVFGGMSLKTGANWNVATGVQHTRAVRLATANITIATDASDAGTWQINNAADIITYLPQSTGVGKGVYYKVTIATGGLSDATGAKIRPKSNDTIFGIVAGATDGENLLLAGATDEAGDWVELVSDGNAGWYVTSHRGGWTRINAT